MYLLLILPEIDAHNLRFGNFRCFPTLWNFSPLETFIPSRIPFVSLRIDILLELFTSREVGAAPGGFLLDPSLVLSRL